MVVSSVLSVPIDEKDEQMLSQMATAKGLSKSQLAAQAIHHYVELNTQYRKHIEERLAQADRGEFASDAEVKASFAKFGVDYDV